MTTTPHDSALSRRGLLRAGAAGGMGIALAGNLDIFAGPAAALGAPKPPTGYGPLIADPAGVLALPAGFSYTLVAKTGGTTLDTGELCPDDPDGIGCFPGKQKGSVLVTNHEVGGSEPNGVPTAAGLTYDTGARGGTTTIEVDRTGNRVKHYVSLAGTHNNCAGGITPWDTWLTCEETEQRKGGRFLRDHGYVFEVDPYDQAANRDPVPLKFLGRYAHEAVVVNPHSSEIYLTEDAGNPHGLYYRWVPPRHFRGRKGALRALALAPGGDTAGQLQAMRCTLDGVHVPDLAAATAPGTKYKVTWINVADRDAQTTSVRKQFAAGVVTNSNKLEGAWWGDGGAYFVASFARTADGSPQQHDGQVWFYDPRRATVELKTLFGVNQTPDVDGANFDGPDNITVSPYGGLILAEDGAGVSHLVGVTEQGKTYALARNDLNDSEFCGPTFSADGRILFANIQAPGHILAITGPWHRRR
ncbi:alkaline phosphatase PhoX [Pilimelia anulata]|uniref:alkaline phosphatase PhoX n=1 Tax=Pilimelia anulata TaxID=53371 RepID=UPI001E444736|nr:alkaline phosphatase PhoX [Pilimelia anulata]